MKKKSREIRTVVAAAGNIWRAYIGAHPEDVEAGEAHAAIQRSLRLTIDNEEDISADIGMAVLRYLQGAVELFKMWLGRAPRQASQDRTERGLAMIPHLGGLYELMEKNRNGLVVSHEPQLEVPRDKLTNVRAVVASWPRSATTWLAATLTSAGMACGHEKLFGIGPEIRDCDGELEVSGFVAPFVDALDAADIPWCLLVRDPCRLIGSILDYFVVDGAGFSDGGLEFVYGKYVEEMRFLASRARFVVQAERLFDNPMAIRRLVDDLGLNAPELAEVRHALEKKPERGRSTPRRIPWSALPKSVQDVGTMLGYGERDDVQIPVRES